MAFSAKPKDIAGQQGVLTPVTYVLLRYYLIVNCSALDNLTGWCCIVLCLRSQKFEQRDSAVIFEVVAGEVDLRWNVPSRKK